LVLCVGVQASERVAECGVVVGERREDLLVDASEWRAIRRAPLAKMM